MKPMMLSAAKAAASPQTIQRTVRASRGMVPNSTKANR